MTLDNNLLKKIENFKRHVLKSIPLPSTNTPSSDNTNGSTGSSLEYARSDHQHPKSTLYAESEHSHNDILSDLLDDINNTTIVVDSHNPIGQDGDTILLRGRMYGDDVSGKSIDYYIGNTLIGSSVTNSNGVSFLDYECDGLGVRNVTAKNGSIVSVPCNVLDCITTTNTHDSWVIGTNVRYEDLDNGVHFTGVNTNTDRVILKQTNNTYLNSNSDWCMDFKLSCSNLLAVYFKDGGDGTDIVNTTSGNLGIDYTTENTVKFTYDASTGTITPNVNGVNKFTLDISSITSNTVGFAFVDWQGDIDITITDFKIYPV